MYLKRVPWVRIPPSPPEMQGVRIPDKESDRSEWGGGRLLDSMLGGKHKRCGTVVDEDEVVLGGEVAVPCHPQSAIAGLNPS